MRENNTFTYLHEFPILTAAEAVVVVLAAHATRSVHEWNRARNPRRRATAFDRLGMRNELVPRVVRLADVGTAASASAVVAGNSGARRGGGQVELVPRYPP